MNIIYYIIGQLLWEVEKIMSKDVAESFNTTSGSERSPAMTRSSSTLSTQPESDRSASITGNRLVK